MIPPNVSTDAGRERDRSDEHPENARSPITRSVESGSKVTFESNVQRPKHNRPRNVTDAGIQIDRSEEHPEKASDSIR
jgi:hypothetical protein